MSAGEGLVVHVVGSVILVHSVVIYVLPWWSERGDARGRGLSGGLTCDRNYIANNVGCCLVSLDGDRSVSMAGAAVCGLT